MTNSFGYLFVNFGCKNKIQEQYCRRCEIRLAKIEYPQDCRTSRQFDKIHKSLECGGDKATHFRISKKN